jgi:hypothetical protein
MWRCIAGLLSISVQVVKKLCGVNGGSEKSSLLAFSCLVSVMTTIS